MKLVYDTGEVDVKVYERRFNDNNEDLLLVDFDLNTVTFSEIKNNLINETTNPVSIEEDDGTQRVSFSVDSNFNIRERVDGTNNELRVTFRL